MENRTTIYAERGKPLYIGREGENNARQVAFDISQWRSTYGPGTVQLLVQRTGETAPYPAALDMDGNSALWTVTAADTAIPGQFGKAELRYLVNDILVKSETWTAIVWDALGEPSETPPEPQKSWVDQVLRAGADAEKAAGRAETAAVRQPYPNAGTGTWWVWDAEKGVYKDSGIASAAYNLTPMTGTALGGALADPAQEGDTQPVRIGADRKLYTAPGGGVLGDYIPNPAAAKVGQTIVVKAVDDVGRPTEWEAGDAVAGKEREIIASGELTEEVELISITTDNDGNPFEITDAILSVESVGTTTNTADGNLRLRTNQNTAANGGSHSPLGQFIRSTVIKKQLQIDFGHGDYINAAFYYNGTVCGYWNTSFNTITAVYLSGLTDGAKTFGVGTHWTLRGVRV